MTEQKELNQGTTQKTFAEAVAQYEPKSTGLISDLDYFEISEPLEDRTANKGKDDEWHYQVLIRDGQEYRVPPSVLGSVKKINEDRVAKGQKPLKAFQVIKSGSGREGTKYQTIPHISGD